MRRSLLIGSAVVLALTVAGCSAQPSTDAEPTSSRTSSPAETATTSPTPQPTLDIPALFPGEIARAEFTPDGGPGGTPQTSFTASGLVEEGVPFQVTGECVGDRVSYEVVRAAVGDSGGLLVGGTIECGTLNASGFASVPYTGPVQLTLGSTDDIEQAWVAVVPGVSG